MCTYVIYVMGQIGTVERYDMLQLDKDWVWFSRSMYFKWERSHGLLILKYDWIYLIMVMDHLCELRSHTGQELTALPGKKLTEKFIIIDEASEVCSRLAGMLSCLVFKDWR